MEIVEDKIRENRASFPPWLKRPVGKAGKKVLVEEALKNPLLHTVCEEAKCPNRGECYASGTATFLVMGEVCTRNCDFCSVAGGVPIPLDKKEAESILEAVKEMGLNYVVITSVTRDDITDGGASHISEIVSVLKRNIDRIKVEVLVPDFKGDNECLDIVIKSKPFVFNHNIETVRSIFSKIRREANFDQSLAVLKYVCENSSIPVKSGFMVGLGEGEQEVRELIVGLKNAGVSILTIGQYLRPSKKQVKVAEFISPKKFEMYAEYAKKVGIENVFSAPFVRSSYKAAEVFATNI